MNLPGFTADGSLYQSAAAYAATARYGADSGGALVPALVRYCRNPRPGWLADNTMCGECADFDLVRTCYGRHCRFTWVQTSNWQLECWPDEYQQ